MSGDNKIKKFRGTILEIAVAALFGVLSVLPLIGLFVMYPLYKVLIAVLPAIFCSMYLQMLLHELGHLIFGLLSGYEFLSFRIGSLALTRSENQIVARRAGSMGTNGQCLMIPPEGEGYSCPYVLYIFGGSLMNLLLAIICLPVYFIWPSLPGAVVYIFGAAGAFTFLMNWIPLKIGGIPNDGYNNLACSKSREARRAFYLILRITGQLYKGVRLRDMDSSWFEISDNADGDPLTACHICFCASRYMDAGNLESARRLFEKAISLPALDEINKKEAACELLYLASLAGREQANKFYTKELEKYINAANESAAAKRCAYSYALTTRADTDCLNSLKKSWRECVDKYVIGAAATMEEELMNSLAKRYSEPV